MAKRHVEFYGSSPNAFGVNIRATEGDEKSPLYYGQQGQAFIHTVAKKFVSKAESLSGDSRFTQKGRKDELKKVANECLKELRSGIKKFIEPLTFKYKNFESTHLPALRKTREPNETIRRMELRQFLSAQDGKKRREIFDKAVAELDDEILGAFFERTDLYQLLGKEIINQGRKQYLQKKAPELLQAETAGAVLTYNAQKTAEDLSLFADTEDGKELLAELPTGLDWNFERNGDFQTIENNQMASVLPSVSPTQMSDGQRISAMAGSNKRSAGVK